MNHSTRRLNTISEALNCQSYLEIGVSQGDTFLSVNCNFKIGVDPYFDFNWKQYHDGEKINLHQITSDQYFNTDPEYSKYDLIFVDGLHTYEQTYRDILNCLLHSHSDTVILIDDTVPCDVFSTLRNPDECIRLRYTNSHQGDSRWHGDTYKVIPLLKLFNPQYNIATIMDNGNPQTLLWRSNSINTPDGHEVMNNLSSMDYLWFLKNIHMYNPTTEKEALERVIDQIKG